MTEISNPIPPQNDIRAINDLIQKESGFIDLIHLEIEKTIIGQKHMIERLMVALLANGHILLEGVPGLAKTLSIKSLASTVNAKFSRIQFTPDLLPADIVGTVIFNQKEKTSKVVKWEIVGHMEGDLKLGHIAYDSPVAKALIGKKINESVDLILPAGVSTYTVKEFFANW